jgi:excinuclease ABC subunit A
MRLGAVNVSAHAMHPRDVGAQQMSTSLSDRRSGDHDMLVVRGAREHNLRDVDLELPRSAMIVFTGLSGSGKSSLAFDTIYAEGQRRYVESLSAYARQFLGQMDKPDVDFIEGLSPAISIDQKSTSRNPRSTVGTITEVYDYLRLLYARIGRPHCPNCGQPIEPQTAEQIIDQIERFEEGVRFQVLAPVVRGRKGEYERLLADLSAQGFARARVDGDVVDLASAPPLARYEQHTIEVIVDRLVAKPGIRRRLADSVETALRLADGIAAIETVPRTEAEGEPVTTLFSEHLACLSCGLSFDRLAPRDFSFNTPYGACETCHGLGTRLEVDADLVVDPQRSLVDGAIRPWTTGSQSTYYEQLLRAVAEHRGFDPTLPWSKLRAGDRRIVLYGQSGGMSVTVSYTNRFGRKRRYRANYEGVIPQLLRRHAESDSDTTRQRIEEYMREVPCSSCNGARLRPLVLAVTVGGKNIAEASAQSIEEADRFFGALELTSREQIIAERVLKEVRERLRFLLDVGLDYLTLDRAAATLAGGEAQRIRLATQIGSGLVGCLYVLDEPSIGLHQRDNERLIDTLLRLRDLGNTVIVVEHDRATIEAADHLVDIGPGAGEHGGEIVHSGSLAGMCANGRSRATTSRAGAPSRCPPNAVPPNGARRWWCAAPASTTSPTSTSVSHWRCSSPSPVCRGRGSQPWSTTSCASR